MALRRRITDQPESKRSRRHVTLVAILAAVAVALAFAAAGVALWLNSSRTSDVAHLARQVRALALRTSDDARVTTAALCALRNDLEVRVASSRSFLAEHPNGIPGISAKAIRDGIANQERTITALAGIDCK